MAATKLTLKLDQDVIQKGKLYAKAHRTSLSKLVERMLRELIVQEESENYPYLIDPDPFVTSIGLSEPRIARPDDSVRDRATYYEYLASRTDE